MQIRRRNRLRHHYTMTSNVILFAYKHLTDAEKVTYQVIDSFDWSDGAGLRKGYAYPSLQRLATLRGFDVRTIRRHLVALEGAGLLSREQRPGRPSLLWIEEPSSEEAERYLAAMTTRPDTDVWGTPDRDVRPYKKDEEEERQNHGVVNGKEGLSADDTAKHDWLATEMLNVLGGVLDVRFYKRVAATVREQRIFEALSEVKTAAREGRIRTSKPAMFRSIIERKEG